MLSLQVQGDLLTFCVETEVHPGDSVSVTVDENLIPLEVESCRTVGDKEFLVTARAPMSLEGLLPSELVLGSRNHHRLEEHLRVMSPELPEYQALTLDVSKGGIRLDVAGALQPGELLGLSLSFPGHEVDVECEVQVLWCRPEGNRFVAGCRFVDPDEFRLRAGMHTLGAALPTPQLPPPRRVTRFAPLDMAG